MIQPDYHLSGTCGASDQNWSTTSNPTTYDATNGYFKWSTCSLTANTEYKFKLCGYNAWTYSFADWSGVTVQNGTKTSSNSGDIAFKSTHAGTAIITLQPITNNMVIHCPYQVSYAAGTNGSGTVSASAVTTYGSTCTLSSSTFSRTGYTQDGWSTTDGGTKTYNLGATYTGGYTDVTLYPHWVANTYTVTLDKNSGSANGSATATYNSTSLTSISAPTKTGYSVEGYYYESACTNKVATSAGALQASTSYTNSSSQWSSASNQTLYTKWTAKTYTATGNLKETDGTSNGKYTATYDATTITINTTPSKSGYHVEGYYTTSALATKVASSTGALEASVSGYTDASRHWTKDANVDLYIKWEEDATNYTLTFGVASSPNNDGSLAVTAGGATATSGTSYTAGSSIACTATPGTHSRVKGWYSDNGCVSAISAAGTADTYNFSLSANTSVYVGFETATTTITLSGNSGSSTSVTATHGSALPSFTASSRTGYALNGYYTASSGGTKIINANGTLVANTDYATNDATPVWKVKDRALTLHAQWTETMSSLTTSCHYDAGSPSYAAPTVSGSATTVGYGTTRTITATAAGTGYTFAGWTLTNCTHTDGGAANATSITIRSNGDGAAASAVANYEEVLTQDTWIIKGGSAFGGTAWSTEHALTKKTGHSTESVVYHTFSIAATNTGDTNADYKFKVVKKGNSDEWYGLTASGDQYYLLRSESGTEKTLSTSGANIELRADAIGDYVVKVDYSNASSPKVTVIFPASVTVSASAENIVYNGSTTLTAKADYLPSTSKTIEYEFFLGNSTADANRIDSKMTYNSVTDTVHSVTKTVTPNFTATDYAASQVYTVRITVDGVAYTRTITIYRKWDIYVRDNQGWGAMSMFQWNSSGNNASYPGTTCTQGVNDNNNWYTVTLNSRYVTTETSDYQSGFILSAGGSTALADATKTVDLHFYSGSPAACTYTEGSYWYIDSSTVDNKKYLTALTLPTTYINEDADACKLINTTEIFLTGNVSSTGGEGSYAHDMLEVGFVIGGILAIAIGLVGGWCSLW
mgnify:CR=1 FL=1